MRVGFRLIAGFRRSEGRCVLTHALSRHEIISPTEKPTESNAAATTLAPQTWRERITSIGWIDGAAQFQQRAGSSELARLRFTSLDTSSGLFSAEIEVQGVNGVFRFDHGTWLRDGSCTPLERCISAMAQPVAAAHGRQIIKRLTGWWAGWTVSAAI